MSNYMLHARGPLVESNYMLHARRPLVEGVDYIEPKGKSAFS